MGKLIGSKIPKIHLFSFISVKIPEVADQRGCHGLQGSGCQYGSSFSLSNVLFLSYTFQMFHFRRYYVAPFFSCNISQSLLIYHVYALVLLNNAIYVNLAWNCLTKTLAFPSSFSGNIKESHFPFARLPTHLLLCPNKTVINIHLLLLLA